MRFKLSILLIIAALLTVSYGVAALSTVSLDRSVAAGTVLADTDSNVAVKFEALGTYATANVMTEDANGKVSFNLNKILRSPATGFNTEAQFGIGSTSSYVFQITNNSDTTIKVSLSGATGGLELYDSAGKVTTFTSINAGSSASFYYKINSAGIAKATAIGGTLNVGV